LFFIKQYDSHLSVVIFVRKRTIVGSLCVSIFLLFFLLDGPSWIADNRLFSNFTDYPLFSQAQGIDPSLSEQYEEILAACVSFGLEDPIVPVAGIALDDALFRQRTVYTGSLRCTYYIYASEDKIYSLWIEASTMSGGRQVPESVRIFPASTSRKEMKQQMST